MLRYYKYSKYKGFTLIEVMIALFIFAILSILTMRGLQTTFMAKQKSKDALDQLAELEIAYSIMQQDLEQIINRNVLQPSGGFKLALLVPVDNTSSAGFKASMETELGYNRLEFTRTGVPAILVNQKLSDLQRVAYYQNGDRIIRHSWRQLDPVGDTAVDRRRLLTEVVDFKIYFVDEYGRKKDVWDVAPSKSAVQSTLPVIELPRGIVVQFSTKTYKDIEWVFILPQALNT